MNKPLYSLAGGFLLTVACVVPTATASADTIKLVNGDTLTGKVIETTDDAVVFEHATLGRVTIAKDQVVVDAKPVPTTDAEKAADELGKWVDSWLFPGWKKSFAAGFSGTDGNSETLNIYANFATGHETDTDRWAVAATYFRNSSDGNTTQNQFKGTVTKDWLKPESEWFYWAQGLYQYDQFESWEQRVGGFVGAGYEFYSGPVHTVRARGGLGAQYEAGDVNDLTPEAVLGVEWAWSISQTQSFNFYNTLYPGLDPFLSEFRNVTGAAYEVKIAAGEGMKLRLGVQNEYESDTQPGDEHNDINYFGALVFDF